ncbi:hypothetical protein EDC27_1099 [Desulfosoma caldarium]|uniref:Uncharacterized protein n=1 Tax=Desulfosoma caldarium TaxID=610254 RepID=A0A3N1VGB1_9BACT|nr:hypothetical protein EDC27_1099 [Desulfosoma caldarium]
MSLPDEVQRFKRIFTRRYVHRVKISPALMPLISCLPFGHAHRYRGAA